MPLAKDSIQSTHLTSFSLKLVIEHFSQNGTIHTLHSIRNSMLCDFWHHQSYKVGCPENAKSFKSQAPQGFSGCLDIENDEINKKFFLSAASLRVKQMLRSSL